MLSWYVNTNAACCWPLAVAAGFDLLLDGRPAIATPYVTLMGFGMSLRLDAYRG